MSTTISSDPFAALNTKAGGAASANSSEAGSADRFLKLLVTQMQNQDPLNPMDNAQITSQMAQINTVSGIQTLNSTVQGLNGQFVQMQALQGAALVGREITVVGNRLAMDEGMGSGAFELATPADDVKVEVLNPAGRVVDTMNMGAQAEAATTSSGTPRTADPALEYRFRIVATSGTQTVATTSLMRDQVQAVSTTGSGLCCRPSSAATWPTARSRPSTEPHPARPAGHPAMSFQQGLSGLNASSKNLEIIGNNIANANTFGTKVSRAEFSDVYAAALNGAGSNSVGIGTNMAAVAQQFTQGAITTSPTTRWTWPSTAPASSRSPTARARCSTRATASSRSTATASSSMPSARS